MATDEKKSSWTWANTITMIGVGIAAAAVSVAFWQYRLAERAQDRAAGKLSAKFEFVGIGNMDEKTTSRLYKKSALGVESLFLDDTNHLLQWNPYAEVMNTGDEIIDGIRIEVRFTAGMIITKNAKDAKPTPYVLSGVTDLDLPLKEKLRPGQKATVSIIKPLLGQMLQAQAQDRGDSEHLGNFEVVAYCKIPGGAAAGDRPDPYKFATLHFVWLPKGFTKEACKDILESQPRVEISGP